MNSKTEDQAKAAGGEARPLAERRCPYPNHALLAPAQPHWEFCPYCGKPLRTPESGGDATEERRSPRSDSANG